MSLLAVVYVRGMGKSRRGMEQKWRERQRSENPELAKQLERMEKHAERGCLVTILGIVGIIGIGILIWIL